MSEINTSVNMNMNMDMDMDMDHLVEERQDDLNISREDDTHKNNNDHSKQKCGIFRFKFTDEVVSKITDFAKIHQFDDRHTYKEAWEEWLVENEDLVDNETRRLKTIGYEHNVQDKMFKSGRYYFRKKSNVAVKPVARREYISIDHTILEAMDNHIRENIENSEYTPAKGYDGFCEEYKDLLAREIANLFKTKTINADDLSLKIKKTYKNRYFIISRQ